MRVKTMRRVGSSKRGGSGAIEWTTTDVKEERRDWRRTVERMLRLANHLPPGDRALVVGAYERGMTAADLARVADTSSRVVQARLRRIVRRLTTREFIYTVREGKGWPRESREIAEEIFVRGATQREAAERLGISVHRVRREADRVRLLVGVERHEGT